MNESPTFQIPKDVIEPIIQSHVALAVSTALQGHSQLVESAIRQVLEAPVNSEGQSSTYSSAIPWVQWAMKTAVKNAVKETLEEELLKYKNQIKKQLVAMLQQKNSKLINQLVEGMVEAMVNPDVFRYRLRIEFDK